MLFFWRTPYGEQVREISARFAKALGPPRCSANLATRLGLSAGEMWTVDCAISTDDAAQNLHEAFGYSPNQRGSISMVPCRNWRVVSGRSQACNGPRAVPSVARLRAISGVCQRQPLSVWPSMLICQRGRLPEFGFDHRTSLLYFVLSRTSFVFQPRLRVTRRSIFTKSLKS